METKNVLILFFIAFMTIIDQRHNSFEPQIGRILTHSSYKTCSN